MINGVEPLFCSRRTPEMQVLVLALILVHLRSACFQPATLLTSVNCSQGLGCQLLGGNGLCSPGDALPVQGPDPVLVLTQMEMRNKLWCRQHQDCIPCVQVMLHLGLLESPALSVKQNGGADMTSQELKEDDGSTEEFLRTHILISAQTYPSSYCVVVEVWLPRGCDRHNRSLGFLQFDCFPVALSGELEVIAFTRPLYQSGSLLRRTHHGPDCTWHKAKDAIRLCQVPNVEVSVGLEEVVLHVSDFPEGMHFLLWLCLNRTRGSNCESDTKLLTGPQNVSFPVSQVLPCLCLQIEAQEDVPRTHLCPFESDPEALARAWAQSHLELKAFDGTLTCTLSAPCDLPGELVPCWRGGPLASCHPLHPQLHLPLVPQVPQEFPRLRPHPNLCVQVRNNGNTYLQSCLHEKSHREMAQHLLLRKTVHPQANPRLHVLEEGTWVPITQAVSMRNGILEEALQNDLQSGECMQVWHTEDNQSHVLWACSLEKYCRKHWMLAWMVALLTISSILLVLLLKKEAIKGWLRILKEDYRSGGALQGRHTLVLYSPDHTGFERLVGTLAGALSQLQLAVSLELWSRGELGSLGPMQWLHAQRHRVLEAGGTVVLLFSKGAIAAYSEWLGWEQKDRLPTIKPDSTFLASLNCILPDFLAGKAKDRYLVACFEELFPADEIPALFCSVPVYPLPSQLFNFLLALAGPKVGQKQKSSLRRHAVWISKSLDRAVQECRHKKPNWQDPPLLPLQSDDAQPFTVS